MTARFAIPAFAAFGIELEYAIVDSATLDVRPYAEQIVAAMRDRERAYGWCHELAAHVVEVRNVEPSPSLDGMAREFQREIGTVNSILQRSGARLLPTGMHPWMDPRTETFLWTLSDPEIYATYDRLFDCRRHGWSNIQSMHINLPFANDDQFRRLHAAIRIVLPLIPALAASSPIVEGSATGRRDHRLWAYATNAARYPAITGTVVPEMVQARSAYDRAILQPMYAAIAGDDAAGVLQHEWLNSRGAIPRFDRSAIEIRLADTQEYPAADLAIAQAVTFATRMLYEERWSTLVAQEDIGTERLRAVLDATIRDAEEAQIDDRGVLGLLGERAPRRRASELWSRLLNEARGEWLQAVAFILARGTLAHRIERALSGGITRDRLRAVYGQLCDCLEQGRPFEG
jgi:gamma-glutamyl:cysteine ligase YbdK (ATP-grasp superfamily)